MWAFPKRRSLCSQLVSVSLIASLFPPVRAQLRGAGAELFFDGVDDYAVAFPTFSLLTEWTIEGWVRPASPVKSGVCVIGIQAASGRNLLTLTTTEDAAWRVLYGSGQEMPTKAWVAHGYSPNSFSASPHHFAITHSVLSNHQSILEFFLNGTQHATWFGYDDDLRARPEIAMPALLGACNQAGAAPGEGGGRGIFRANFFHGHMDEVRLWSTVRTQQEIQLAMTWTGPASAWPTPADISLTAQYSCDVTTQELRDSTSYNNHGWLGTTGNLVNSPEYLPSSFGDDLFYGPEYLQIREYVPFKVELLPYIYHETISYNAVLIVQAPTNIEAQLRLPGDLSSTPFVTGQLVSTLSFDVLANATISNGSFAVRPCRGFPLQVPQTQYCTDPIIYYAFSSNASVAPFAGPSYAVQLLSAGGYINLPRLPANSTLEFWADFTPPLIKDSTLLSISEVRASRNTQEREHFAGTWMGCKNQPRLSPLLAERCDWTGGFGEIVRWWLDPYTGAAVLDVCTLNGLTSIVVPGVASIGPQHLALSFEELDTIDMSWNYSVKVYRNCQLVAQAIVYEPCARLDSANLRQPTMGQRYVPDEVGSAGTVDSSSASFLPMFIAEIRLWSIARDSAELCLNMSDRLNGNESFLFSYTPVLSADVERQQRETIGLPVLLSNEVLPSSVSQVVTPNATTLVCATGFAPCPDFTSSSGFVIRPSPFALPPEVASFDTARGTLSIPLVAHDDDNFKIDVLDSISLDSLRYEILQVPDPKCGHIYAKDETFRLLGPAARASFGLTPATTIIESFKLPLRFVPFEGATFLEEEEMGGACSDVLKYRALDFQGLASTHLATVRINVWHEGVILTSVNASDPGAGDGGLDSGDIIRFDFNFPTNEPVLEARDLFDIEGGSWGNSSPTLVWINNGTTLLVQMDSDSYFGANSNARRLTQMSSTLDSNSVLLTPNLTRFRARGAVGLQRRGDPLSQPFAGISPPLVGSFSEATCPPGAVLNWTSGDCDVCPVGTYWKIQENMVGMMRSGVECVACPAGSFGNDSAALSCFPCIPGRYMPPVDNETLSDNRTECLEAPVGTFVAFSNASEVEPCQPGTVAEEEGRIECSVCPANANCDAGPIPRSQALARPGYFRVTNGSFVGCRIPTACPGANICKDGTQDNGLGCYPCADEWTRFSGAIRDARECAKCPSLVHGLFIAISVGVGTGLFAIFLTRINITAARHIACLHPFMLKICLSHFQLMSAFGRFEEWELKAGFGDSATFLRYLFSWIFAWDGMMPSYLIPMDCILREFSMGRDARLWFQLVFWATLPFTFLLSCLLLGALVHKVCELSGCLCACLRCCSKLKPERHEAPSHRTTKFSLVHPALVEAEEDPVLDFYDGDPYETRAGGIWRKTNLQDSFSKQTLNFFYDSSGLLLASLILTYPSVLQQLLAFIRCDSLDGNTSEARLLVEPSLICGKGPHAVMFVVSFVALMMWGLGFPAFCGILLYRNRKWLNEFSTHCRLGLLGAEYEPRYFFWDAFILLRRFAAIVAMLVAPGASRALQLAILLGLGLVSLFVHVLYLPFDNRSGQLLDVMETQALKIFCAMCAVMLLGFSGVTHHAVCFTLAFTALLVHILFLVRVFVNFIVQVNRSYAEGLIDSEMLGRGPKLGERVGPLRTFQERIFLIDSEAKMCRAHVYFKDESTEIELADGPQGGEPTDYERTFLAQGLAECIASVVTEHKFERVSVHLVEFITRLAFSDKWKRLCCMDHQYRILSEKHKPNDIGKIPPIRPSLVESPSTMWKKLSTGSSAANMFNPSAFGLGLSAGDFQLELISISVCKRSQLEKSFTKFMERKGVHGLHELNARDRLLGSIWHHKNDILALPPSLSGLPPQNAIENGSSGHLALQVRDDPGQYAMSLNSQTEGGRPTEGSLDTAHIRSGLGMADSGMVGLGQTFDQQPPLTMMVSSAAGFTPERDNGTKAVEDLTTMFEVKTEVVEFTKRAIEGVWCTYFRERTNEWVKCLYSLDEGAKYFILLTGDNIETQELVCAVASITQVSSLQTDRPEDFPNAIMDSVPETIDLDRLVMVTYNRSGKLTRFCLLEKSASWRSHFVRSMDVLAAYRRTIRDEEMAEA